MEAPKPTLHRQVGAFCDGELIRVFDIPNVHYIGSGFFRTDKWQYEKPEDE